MNDYGRLTPLSEEGGLPFRLLEPPSPTAEELLFEERERAQVTLDSIGDAVISTDVMGRVTYMNRAAEQMTGWPLCDARRKPVTAVFHVIDADTRKPARNPATQAMRDNRTVALAANSILVRHDGDEVAIEDSVAPIHNRYGRVTGAVVVFHDVRFSQTVTDRMAYLASHDALTDLPNRVALAERFSHATALARRHHRKVALLFVDLDNFKEVNDALGHEAGDRLLVNLARMLVSCVRKTDTVCRYGGDEFVVLLSEIERLDHPERMAEKLRRAVSAPGLLEGYSATLTLSIGISVYPDDGIGMEELLHEADSAMYDRKEADRPSVLVPGLGTSSVLARTRSMYSRPGKSQG